MQTFLPYPDFQQSTRVLDNKRLGKQRVEAMQILQTLTSDAKAWRNHPAVKMWAGYEPALAEYCLHCCLTWLERGFNDSIIAKVLPYYQNDSHPIAYPPWLGDEAFHTSHQSNLLRKDAEHYNQFFSVPDDLPYIWPTKEERWKL